MALENPDWDWKSVSFADPEFFAITMDASRRLGPIMDMNNPDLGPLKKLGGKLIIYHGYNDPIIWPRSTIDYFESVQKTMGGGKATQDFVRLFRAPGMGHCGGGPGPTFLTRSQRWNSGWKKGRLPIRSLPHMPPTARWIDRARCVHILRSHDTRGQAVRTLPQTLYAPLNQRLPGSPGPDKMATIFWGWR